MPYKEALSEAFFQDMKKAGFYPYYAFAGDYEGPAVQCTHFEFQRCVEATRITVTWKEVPSGYIIYPIR